MVESQVLIYRASVTIEIVIWPPDEDLPDLIPCHLGMRSRVHVGPRGPLLAMDTQYLMCRVLKPCVF